MKLPITQSDYEKVLILFMQIIIYIYVERIDA